MIKSIIAVFTLFFYLAPWSANSFSDNQFSLVTQNLNRFFDDKDDGNSAAVLSTRKYQKRVNQVVEKIHSEYKLADLLLVQEVENIDVLRDISDRVQDKHGITYLPLLVEGNDSSGIDVGYLVRDSWKVKSLYTVNQKTTYNRQGAKLFSRPPLVIEMCYTQCVTVMNLHLRSMRGLRDRSKGRRVALKRQKQAESVARWVQQFQQKYPDRFLIVAGDFNALTPADKYVDLVGTIKGSPNQTRPRWKSPDLVEPDLVDISLRVPSRHRFSYRYKGSKQQLDYVLISSNLRQRLRTIRFGKINYRFSDHAAVIASFALN